MKRMWVSECAGTHQYLLPRTNKVRQEEAEVRIRSITPSLVTTNFFQTADWSVVCSSVNTNQAQSVNKWTLLLLLFYIVYCLIRFRYQVWDKIQQLEKLLINYKSMAAGFYCFGSLPTSVSQSPPHSPTAGKIFSRYLTPGLYIIDLSTPILFSLELACISLSLVSNLWVCFLEYCEQNVYMCVFIFIKTG